MYHKFLYYAMYYMIYANIHFFYTNLFKFINQAIYSALPLYIDNNIISYKTITT